MRAGCGGPGGVDGDTANVRTQVAVRGPEGVMLDAGSYTGRCTRTAAGWRIRELRFSHRFG